MSPKLEAFSNFFSSLDNDKLSSLNEVYSKDLTFIDPVHRVEGIDPLSDYLEKLCLNLNYCRFVFHRYTESDSDAWLVWTMEYSHPKISGGKHLTLDGASELRFDGNKVCYHRDFYDMGAMLYEHLPLVGGLVRYIKSKLVK